MRPTSHVSGIGSLSVLFQLENLIIFRHLNFLNLAQHVKYMKKFYNLGARLHCTLYFSACFANGTIAFENPNTILYTDVMAVQYEGVSSAFNCDCTWSGNWVLITGCNTVFYFIYLFIYSIFKEVYTFS